MWSLLPPSEVVRFGKETELIAFDPRPRMCAALFTFTVAGNQTATVARPPLLRGAQQREVGVLAFHLHRPNNRGQHDYQHGGLKRHSAAYARHSAAYATPAALLGGRAHDVI